MSGFVLLHADRAATLLADDPVVPAADVETFTQAARLLGAAEALRVQAMQGHEAIVADARAAGFAEGRAEGLAAGEAAIREQVAVLARADGERGDALRGDLARLALEVVRRIAGEIGDAATVAAIAERAAAAVVPETSATVRVHPQALDATRARLAGLRHAAVEADATLGPTDCVVETAAGRVHAGLETQLAQLARTWGIAE